MSTHGYGQLNGQFTQLSIAMSTHGYGQLNGQFTSVGIAMSTHGYGQMWTVNCPPAVHSHEYLAFMDSLINSSLSCIHEYLATGQWWSVHSAVVKCPVTWLWTEVDSVNYSCSKMSPPLAMDSGGLSSFSCNELSPPTVYGQWWTQFIQLNKLSPPLAMDSGGLSSLQRY